MVKWIIATALLFPIAEIVVFALVAMWIGLIRALILLLATTLLGILVLRRVGRGRLAGFRVAVGDRNMTAVEGDGGALLIVLGGILLVIPGFITGLAGLLLLLGPIRRWCADRIRQGLRGREHAANAVVDLEPEEWRQVPDRELEQSRRRRDEG